MYNLRFKRICRALVRQILLEFIEIYRQPPLRCGDIDPVWMKKNVPAIYRYIFRIK